MRLLNSSIAVAAFAIFSGFSGGVFAQSEPVATPAVPLAPIEGTWKTLNGSEITVRACETGFCGTLSWIVIPPEQTAMCQSMPKEDFATLILDYKNVEKSLQTRPLMGVSMLKIKPTNDPNAYTASIYNAEDGKTYDGLFWVVNGTQTLRLGGGCLGSLCAVTQDWPKVPDRADAPGFSCDGA